LRNTRWHASSAQPVGEADLLTRALEEVKTKSYQESETSLDDTQALNVLVSYFKNPEPGKEARQKPVD
jgi:hypothetical protein